MITWSIFTYLLLIFSPTTLANSKCKLTFQYLNKTLQYPIVQNRMYHRGFLRGVQPVYLETIKIKRMTWSLSVDLRKRFTVREWLTVRWTLWQSTTVVYKRCPSSSADNGLLSTTWHNRIFSTCGVLLLNISYLSGAPWTNSDWLRLGHDRVTNSIDSITDVNKLSRISNESVCSLPY